MLDGGEEHASNQFIFFCLPLPSFPQGLERGRGGGGREGEKGEGGRERGGRKGEKGGAERKKGEEGGSERDRKGRR